MKVLTFAGSLRNDSWNRRLVRAANYHAPKGLTVEVYEDLQEIPLFSEDLESSGDPEPVRSLKQAVAASDGLLISTPEYNHSIPGVLKNAIDWLSRPPERVLHGLPAAVLSVTSGSSGGRLAQAGLRHVLSACRCLVLPTPEFHLGDAAAAFDVEGRRLIADAATAALERLLEAFEDWTGHWQRSKTA